MTYISFPSNFTNLLKVTAFFSAVKAHESDSFCRFARGDFPGTGRFHREGISDARGRGGIGGGPGGFGCWDFAIAALSSSRFLVEHHFWNCLTVRRSLFARENSAIESPGKSLFFLSKKRRITSRYWGDFLSASVGISESGILKSASLEGRRRLMTIGSHGGSSSETRAGDACDESAGEGLRNHEKKGFEGMIFFFGRWVFL